MTTKTKLTVLALAAATFTTASLVASTASAKPAHGFYPKHGPVTGTGTFKQADGGTISGTGTFQIPPKEAGDGTISGTGTFQIPPKEAGGGVISGTGTFHLPPTKWGGNPPRGGDGDGDHDGHHGYGWGYGYGAPVVVEGAPVAVAAPAPVGAPAAPEAPCNCLTKQSMPDGSVLFQDICTKESWVVAPRTVGAR